MAERRLSRLQERDRAPRIPPRPPHTTPLLSESEPGDSPALLPPPLLLLLVPRSPLVCPLDSLGHCCALIQAGPSSSHRLAGGWAPSGGAGQGAEDVAAGLPGHGASAPRPGPGPAPATPLESEGEGESAGGRAASSVPSPPPGCRRSEPADITGFREGGFRPATAGSDSAGADRTRLRARLGTRPQGAAHPLAARSGMAGRARSSASAGVRVARARVARAHARTHAHAGRRRRWRRWRRRGVRRRPSVSAAPRATASIRTRGF